MRKSVDVITLQRYHTHLYLPRKKDGELNFVVVNLTHMPRDGMIDVQYTDTNILIGYEYEEGFDFVVDVYRYPVASVNGWLESVDTLYDEWNSKDLDAFIEAVMKKVEAWDV